MNEQAKSNSIEEAISNKQLQSNYMGLLIVRDANNFIVTIPIKDVQLIVYDNMFKIYISVRHRNDTILITNESLGVESAEEMHAQYINMITY